jgi:hypothetical protein
LIVLADAAPVLNLAAVGKLDLLRALYGQMVVPFTVQSELSRNEADLDPAWTRVVKPRNPAERDPLLDELDPGEKESMAVAAAVRVRLLLLDEKRCRHVASQQGLEVTGLLGVLAEAKARGLIKECKPILDDLLRLTGFWIGDDLRSHYLRSLNELD